MPDNVTLTEVKDALDAGMTAFEEHKKTVEQHSAEIAKFGSALPETEAKLAKLDEAITERSDLVDKFIEQQNAKTKAAEEIAEKSEKRLADLETALSRPGTSRTSEEQIKAAQRATEFAAQIKADKISTGEWREPEKPLDLDWYDGYCKSFDRYLRKGEKQLADTEVKELSVAVQADGGYWVTPVMMDTVITRLFETSPMRSVASVMTISTDAVEFPNDLNSAVSGGWVGEKDSRAETATPQIGTTRIPVHEQYAEPHATQKLLDDAAIDAEAWLAGKIADILERTENTAFVSGNGERKPRGFLDYGSASTTQADTARSWGVLQHVVSGAAADFDGTNPGDAFIEVVHTLKSAYRGGARWMMNRRTVGVARRFKDGQGNYLWEMGNIQNSQPSNLVGYGITEAEDMPDHDTADVFPVAFGNWGLAYQIVDRQGISVLRDPFTNKPFVKFYTTKRVGGDVINFDALKLIKISA